MARIGLLGGTGLDAWAEGGARLSPKTSWGTASAAIHQFKAGRHTLLFLPRHGDDHSIPPHRINYRANLAALQASGASRVLAINAVGGIHPRFPAGALAVPDQLIDYTWGRKHSFSDGPEAPLQHVEFAQPFSASLRQGLLDAARRAGIEVLAGGCIGVTQGPRLETAAEIVRLGRDGCDMVGMTSMPEAALARELDLPYAALCVVANAAAGVGELPISMADIGATLQRSMLDARRLLEVFLEGLDGTSG